MSKTIIDIFMYIFEAVLLWHYGNTVFNPKYSKGVCLLFALLAHTILFFVYQLGIVYLNAALLVVLYALYFFFVYQNKISSSLFHAVVFVIVMFASEILVMGIGTIFYKDFNAMESKSDAYIYVVVTSKLLYFIIIMAICRLASKNREERSYYNKYYWLLFILPLSSILILLSFRYVVYNVKLTPKMNLLWIISSIFMLFANVLVFIIYEYSERNTRELYKLKTEKLQEEQDKKYFELIESSNEDMRGFAHDIKNHLIQIENIDNVDGVRSYIDGLLNEVDRFTYTGISKNKMLDLIISKYMRVCESKNIRFDADVKTANLSYIKDVDLSTLLNNLLDNAVESAANAKEGFVKLSVFSRNALYDGLIIRNSCPQRPNEVNGKLQTSKQNKKEHGIGMSNISKVVKKYDAVYDWKYIDDEGVFETHIALKKR